MGLGKTVQILALVAHDKPFNLLPPPGGDSSDNKGIGSREALIDLTNDGRNVGSRISDDPTPVSAGSSRMHLDDDDDDFEVVRKSKNSSPALMSSSGGPGDRTDVGAKGSAFKGPAETSKKSDRSMAVSKQQGCVTRKSSLKSFFQGHAASVQRKKDDAGSAKKCAIEIDVSEPFPSAFVPEQGKSSALLLPLSQQHADPKCAVSQAEGGASVVCLETAREKHQTSLPNISQTDKGSIHAFLGKSAAPKKRLQKGGTLVVCPMSLLGQWVEEISAHLKPGHLTVHVHYGGDRTASVLTLGNFDVILT